MRTDAIIDRKQVICKNSSMIGYSTVKVCFGMIVRYKNGDFETMTGRVAGRVAYAPALGETPTIRNYLLVIALGPNLTHAMERWINPDDVVEAYDPNNLDRHKSVQEFISAFFSPDWLSHKPNEFRSWVEYGSNTIDDYKRTEHYQRNQATLRK